MEGKDIKIITGLQPTWPAGNPLLITPIDHFLISKNLTVIHRYTGPDIGSDHYPVTMEIAFKLLKT